jgi:hypothetical protein
VLIDTPTDSRGVYTPMTRGREANLASIVTEENQTALDVLTQAVTRDWIDLPAVRRRAELEQRRSGITMSASADARLTELEEYIRRTAERRRRTQQLSPEGCRQPTRTPASGICSTPTGVGQSVGVDGVLPV